MRELHSLCYVSSSQVACDLSITRNQNQTATYINKQLPTIRQDGLPGNESVLHNIQIPHPPAGCVLLPRLDNIVPVVRVMLACGPPSTCVGEQRARLVSMVEGVYRSQASAPPTRTSPPASPARRDSAVSTFVGFEEAITTEAPDSGESLRRRGSRCRMCRRGLGCGRQRGW